MAAPRDGRLPPRARAGAARRAPARVHHSRSTQRQTRTVFYTWKRDTHNTQCAHSVDATRRTLAHTAQYTTPSKTKFSHTARPVHGATSVGVSSRRRRARRPRHLRARAARYTGHHHRRPDPATRHEPRCELSRSCECAAQWWAAVGMRAPAPLSVDRPPFDRERCPRAAASCHRTGRLAGSMGRGGAAEARAPARSVPQLAFHQPAPFARFVASEVIGLSVELVRRRSCGAPHGSLRDRRVGRRNEGASGARVRLGEGSGVETPAPQAHHAPPRAKVASPPLAKPLVHE